jgi:hypothetical protein
VPETVDIRPAYKSIAGYGGDTLSFNVTVPAGAIDGYLWSGQVRSSRLPDNVLEAEFLITPPALPGDPAIVSLPAVITRALADKGVAKKQYTPDGQRRMTLVYTGDYDIQVRPPDGDDPTITIMQGVITIDMDVTRLAE